jgi:hypothetical protein
MNVQPAARSDWWLAGQGVAQRACHAPGAEGLGAGDAVGVETNAARPSGHELGAGRTGP